jgi:hypothetical protein
MHQSALLRTLHSGRSQHLACHGVKLTLLEVLRLLITELVFLSRVELIQYWLLMLSAHLTQQ